MGLEIEYRDSRGRRHNSLDSMMKSEMGKLVDQMSRDVERAVRSQRCAVHGQTPSVSVSRAGDQISYTINGCCDEVVSRAESAAAAAT